MGQIFEFIFPSEVNVDALVKYLRANVHEHFYENVVYFWKYKGDLVHEAIWQIKYKRRAELIDVCADVLLGHLYKKFFEDESGNKNTRQDDKFVLVSVPSYKTKKNQKGFNQTELLCEALIKKDSRERIIFSYTPDLIQKIRQTKSQAETKSKKERLQNLVGAFACTSPEKIRGKKAIIIDDVYTTGATVAEIRNVLLKAQPIEIIALTLAH